jgi:linoleoyl-CoA desaturase
MNPSKPRYASASSTPLAKALQDGAAQYLSANEAHRYANTGVFLKIAVLFAVVIALYWPTLKAVSPLQFILAYIGFIVMGMVLAMNSLHDAAHDAVFKSALWC